ncbi:hypothetical protein [Streptomyces niveiscabiei]|uniref:hypothetical protein n=1 Tax=Streptomyces niveiscabiei TaxID=164115 RepID=UPI0038F72D80
MTQAFYSDAAETVLADLTAGEQAAVDAVRKGLETDPEPAHARGLPDADPLSESYAIELLPEQTGGRGVSVVYRYVQDLDACLISWIIAGP